MVSSKESEATVLDLQSALVQLRNPAPGRVLSVYLDTSPARTDGLKYLLTYRDAVRSLRRDLSDTDSAAFEAAATWVDRYLTEEFRQHGHGLALFAAGSLDGLVVVPLPQSPPTEHVAWQDRPEIVPLEAMLDEFERIAVVLFDTERARLFTVFLGAIEGQQTLHAEVPGKQATGGWFGLQQTSFARHREDHLRCHAQHTAHALMRTLRTRSFDRLLIGGPDEALAVLRHQLARPLRGRLAGTLNVELFASDAEVLEATLDAAKVIERQDEKRLVDELLDSASTPRVAVGLAGTLDALAEGRVYLLIVADSFAESGAQCSTCARLMTDSHRCPGCGTSTEPVCNLHEAIVQQALAEGARLETVGGDAAARLTEHGGIGAWTRF
jgi:peptide subunit release factor 1 (eRF1)